VTADTSKAELRSRTLQALQHEGYVGRGEVTVLSDGAEIMKRLPRALPKPAAHIIDWFHIAMKIQPLQQAADHVARAADSSTNKSIADDVRSVKWKLWHGQVDRAIDRLENITRELEIQCTRGDRSAKQLVDLAKGPCSPMCVRTAVPLSIMAPVTDRADGSLRR